MKCLKLALPIIVCALPQFAVAKHYFEGKTLQCIISSANVSYTSTVTFNGQNQWEYAPADLSGNGLSCRQPAKVSAALGSSASYRTKCSAIGGTSTTDTTVTYTVEGKSLIIATETKSPGFVSNGGVVFGKSERKNVSKMNCANPKNCISTIVSDTEPRAQEINEMVKMVCQLM